MVFALFKPFLREKLRSRIIFHGTDRKSLHKYMDPKCLAACYGGTLEIPRVGGPQWYQLLQKCDKEYEGIKLFEIRNIDVLRKLFFVAAINSYGYNKKVEK